MLIKITVCKFSELSLKLNLSCFLLGQFAVLFCRTKHLYIMLCGILFQVCIINFFIQLIDKLFFFFLDLCISIPTVRKLFKLNSKLVFFCSCFFS